MGLDHDFLLLDRNRDGECNSMSLAHDPRSIHLHDDFVRYIQDTLDWIPTTNPGRNERHQGLCMWGVSWIEVEGAEIAGRVFAGWSELLALGPTQLKLTGSFSWATDDATAPDGERAEAIEGGNNQLDLNRDEVVAVLRQLAGWCRQVHAGAGRLYLYHCGV